MRSQRRSTFLWLVFTGSLLAGCSHLPQPATSLHGTWMNEDYLGVLARSFSPKAAFAVTDVPVVGIDTIHRKVVVVLNFHEGSRCDIDPAPVQGLGLVLRRCEGGAATVKVIRPEGKAIRVEYVNAEGTTLSTRYIRIASRPEADDRLVEAFVARTVLAGTYRDPQGTRYTFTDRQAEWGEQKFQYRVQLDFVLFSPLDTLCVVVGEERRQRCRAHYGFARNSGELQLYRYDTERDVVGPLVHELLRESDPVRDSE